MRKSFAAIAALAGAMVLAAAAQAQPQTQPKEPDVAADAAALGQCLVLNTSGADRVALARWIVSAMASIPQLKGMASVEPAKHEEADRAMAAIFTRLITQDCIREARPLMRAGGTKGIEIAFQSLGAIAMQEVMTGEGAQEALGSYTRFLDFGAFAGVLE